MLCGIIAMWVIVYVGSIMVLGSGSSLLTSFLMVISDCFVVSIVFFCMLVMFYIWMLLVWLACWVCTIVTSGVRVGMVVSILLVNGYLIGLMFRVCVIRFVLMYLCSIVNGSLDVFVT